jgi:hypothetical protein
MLSLNLDTPGLARHYEESSSDRQFKVGKVLVEKLGVRTGDSVLDVGSGTGLLAGSRTPPTSATAGDAPGSSAPRTASIA